MYHICNSSFDICFATTERLDLESRYQSRVKAALEFARRIDDFDDLVDPCHLYDHCLGPEPSRYVLKYFEKRKVRIPSFSFFFLFFWFICLCFLHLFLILLATRYSKDKYAHVKGMKNEPLSQLAIETKKRKLNKEKGETTTSPIIYTAPSSPIPSLEMVTFSPPTTRSKGKSKIGKRIWKDPATALGRAHNVVTDEDLKGLSFIPSHELVSRHIHKLVQVLYLLLHH